MMISAAIVGNGRPASRNVLPSRRPTGKRAATAEYLAHQHADLIVEGAWRVAGVRAGEVKLMEDDNAAPFHGTQQGADNWRTGRVGRAERSGRLRRRTDPFS